MINGEQGCYVEGVNTAEKGVHPAIKMKDLDLGCNIFRSRVVESVNTGEMREDTRQLKPGFSFKRLLLGWPLLPYRSRRFFPFIFPLYFALFLRSANIFANIYGNICAALIFP